MEKKFENLDTVEIKRDDIIDEIEYLLESEELPRGPKFTFWRNLADDDQLNIDELIKLRDEIYSTLEARKVLISDFKLYIDAEFFSENEKQRITEKRLQFYTRLISSVSDSQEFLGNGAVAEVFHVKGYEDFCVKKVSNFDMYHEYNFKGNKVQNSLEEEAEFLLELKKFEVNGVRTPKPYFYVSKGDFIGYVMEELKAVNFSRVIEGFDKLPENFDLNNYFKKLGNYLEKLHKEKGILHKDIALRNLMIDRETGDPKVIDFGRSKRRADYLANPDIDFDEETENEMSMLNILKREAVDKLTKIGYSF